MTRSLTLVLLVLFGALPRIAAAQDQRDRAAEHFDRGIVFYNEQRFDAALAEFLQAYEIEPAPEAMYNVARVYAALGRAVQAARSYERYLNEGGRSIGAARRREAERALEQQQSRIGYLMVQADVSHATISIDGVDVASTPLSEPIPLAAGAHNVEVRAAGREPVRREVAIAGRETAQLVVALAESIERRGTLRVTSSVPEVAIAVDGETVGATPLGTTVPLRAGRHVVSASRAGYRPEARDVVIEDGAEAEVHFDMRRDPSPRPAEIGVMRLRLPNAPYLVRIDGETMLGLELELPVGAHTIELEVMDRQPYEGSIRVPSGDAILIVPPLAWTLDARRQRLDAAAGQRAVGIALTVAGGIFLAGGLPVLIWNEGEISTTDARIVELQRLFSMCMVTTPAECDALEEEGAELTARQGDQNIFRGVSITGVVVGAALAALGLTLLFTAPSDDSVDAEARARAQLSIGPGGVQLDGAF
jgi:hypothetical protein